MRFSAAIVGLLVTAIAGILIVSQTAAPSVSAEGGVSITSITPARGAAGTQMPVVIEGTGFPTLSDCEDGYILVLFGSMSAAPMEQPTSTKVRVLAPSLPAGPVDVTIMNSCDGTSDTVVGGYTYVGVGFISGSIPKDGGFGLVVFGGGSNDDLIEASGCPEETATFWATDDGDFVTFIPGAAVSAVNNAWNTLFVDEIPYNTALIGRCF